MRVVEWIKKNGQLIAVGIALLCFFSGSVMLEFSLNETNTKIIKGVNYERAEAVRVQK